MRHQGEDQGGDVHQDQHAGDDAAHDLALRRTWRGSPQREQRRHQQAGHRQGERRRVHRGRSRVERLTVVLDAAHEQRQPEDQQEVPEDRAGERRLHHLDPVVQDQEDGDDQLGDVAERRVDEAADPRARVQRELLRRPADQPGERHDRRRRRQEDRQVSGAPNSRIADRDGASTNSQSSEGRSFTARSLEAQTEWGAEPVADPGAVERLLEHVPGEHGALDADRVLHHALQRDQVAEPILVRLDLTRPSCRGSRRRAPSPRRPACRRRPRSSSRRSTGRWSTRRP